MQLFLKSMLTTGICLLIDVAVFVENDFIKKASACRSYHRLKTGESGFSANL